MDIWHARVSLHFRLVPSVEKPLSMSGYENVQESKSLSAVPRHFSQNFDGATTQSAIRNVVS